ncbi:hypothetical protein [Promicromonospora sp. NPDC050249]|uniref:hypothetical protein n=1 Tax=Promicromonospora sp. NPDC050249 TaxID=3154743 RepID=UPI003401D7DF
MVSSAITPTRTIAILIGVAVIAVAGFAVVRSGVFEPETVQGAIPGPGSSSPSVSASRSPSASPSPTLTAAPEPTTPAQIKAKNIADAKARLVEYYETTASVANNGYKDWEVELPPFWGHPDFHTAMRPVFDQYADEGRYTVGVAHVESMKVTSYAPSSVQTEEVGLEACVDFGDVETFERDGTVIARDRGVPTRYLFQYLMRNQGATGEWTVYREIPESERAC